MPGEQGQRSVAGTVVRRDRDNIGSAEKSLQVEGILYSACTILGFRACYQLHAVGWTR